MIQSRNKRFVSLAFLRTLASIVAVVFFVASSRADIVEPSERDFVAAERVGAAQNKSHEISGISVGIGGAYKNGFQTQVVVFFKSTEIAPTLELETHDGDGVPFTARHETTEEEAGAGRVETRFILPKATGKLTVRLIAKDQIVDERVFEPDSRRAEGEGSVFGVPASPSKPIYLVVGDAKAGFSEAFAELRLKEERRPEIVALESIEQLPTDFRSLESIDRIFLTTADVSLYDGYDARSPQFAAIYRWVQNGGHVVIFAGKDSVNLLSPGGALADLSPGANVEPKTHEFRVVNALSSELQNVKNLAMTGSRSNPFLQTPVLSELKKGSTVEMREAETPLLVSRAVGLGSVVFFAADLAAPPIANWSGRGRLMLKILGIDPDATSLKNGSSNAIKRGYVDYSGQIRSALDRFDDVRPIPFALIAALLLAYVVVIAPLDWFLAKKVFKRPIVTWATFPIFVVLFSVIAVAIFKTKTPKEETFNQLDLLDVDMESGIVRDISWFGVYSPVGERYDMKFKPDVAGINLSDDASGIAAPLTLSGSGLGGAEQKTFMPRQWDKPYRLEGETIRDVPMATRSSKSFIASWLGSATNLPEPLELSDDGLSLRGTIVNPFDVPIYSAYIVYKGGACALGVLPPGETKIDRGAARVEPMRVINEQRSSIPSDRAATWDSTTYNSASERLPYILRSATFYDFAGGADNFGIEKRLQREVDLSELLRCGRAVVFGAIVDPECEKYRPTEDLSRLSFDSIELERLNKKLAAQKGEEYRDVKAETLEKYGLYGTSPEFTASEASFSRSRANDNDERGAAKRTVVTRLIFPINLGTRAEADR